MKNISKKLKTLFNKLPETNNWKFWFLLALCVKFLFFFYTLYEIKELPLHYKGSFSLDESDTASYLEPIENLLKYGNYFNDFRMPGYGWLYYILRFVFEERLALDALLIIQVILSALSVYVLANIAYLLFKRKSFFIITYGLYLISTFVSIYDIKLLTESFCVSTLIFSTYYLINDSTGKGGLFLSGLFLTWSIFLKPIIIPLLIIFSIYILLINFKTIRNPNVFKRRSILIFAFPFLLIDGAWIARNLIIYGHITPLTKSIYYTGTDDSALGSLIEFMNAFGGSTVWWQPGSDITFFMTPPENTRKKINVTPPEYIYTSKFNYDSLLVVRKLIQQIDMQGIPDSQDNAIVNKLKSKLRNYTESIKEEKPFLYYLGSRLKVFKTFFVHSGTYNLFHRASFELNSIELLIKIFYSGLYVFIIVFGFIGSFWMFFKGLRETNYLLISTIGLYIAFIYPFILKMDQFRYFVPGYPFFLIAAVFVLHKILDSLSKGKAPISPKSFA